MQAYNSNMDGSQPRNIRKKVGWEAQAALERYDNISRL